jgi:hypothetical protein
MKIQRTTLVLLSIAALCLGAHAATCSLASAAGQWGFSYTGIALTPSGQIPIASAGRYSQDASGDMHGTEVRNLAGMPANETIKGKFTVNANCTTELHANVYENGQLVRTSVIDGVLVENSSKLRAIFRSVVLPDGTNLPVVITIEGEKMF